MNPYLIAALAGAIFGAGMAGTITHTVDSAHYGALIQTGKVQLAGERAAHQADLTEVAEAASAAQDAAIVQHNADQAALAKLDVQFTQEKAKHEKDNAQNRAAIADGARRLRIAVENFHADGSNAAAQGASASGVGDGSGGTAELPPAFGSTLYGIADDADADARAKADYLQQYVCQLEESGVVADTCEPQ